MCVLHQEILEIECAHAKTQHKPQKFFPRLAKKLNARADAKHTINFKRPNQHVHQVSRVINCRELIKIFEVICHFSSM